MSTETEIRARIAALVGAVSNVGNVYDYFRYINDWNKFKDEFGYTVDGPLVLRTWFVSCEAVTPQGFVSGGSFGGGLQTAYTYKIRGYFGLNDEAETEKAALAVALAVLDVLNTNSIFTGTDAYTATPAVLDPFSYATWGGVMCHYAEITQIYYVQ